MREKIREILTEDNYCYVSCPEKTLLIEPAICLNCKLERILTAVIEYVEGVEIAEAPISDSNSNWWSDRERGRYKQGAIAQLKATKQALKGMNR